MNSLQHLKVIHLTIFINYFPHINLFIIYFENFNCNIISDTQKNLYSREFWSLDLSAVNKLNLIIYGMRGVETENVKKIVLSSPLSVIIIY